MEGTSEIPLRSTSDRALAEDWVLVLLALGLSPRVQRTATRYVVSVTQSEWPRAHRGLAAYESENAKPTVQDEPVVPVRLRSGTAMGIPLLLFFLATAFYPGVAWLEHGSANAGRIVGGELWRTVTALSLHADFPHALSNAVAAAVFGGALYGFLGAGLGSLLLLLLGAGGNLLNALMQDISHVSLGASTAIFAAVGMLGTLVGVRLHRQISRGRRRAWLPAAAALALLAMLGAGGPKVDVLAHLSGFLVGSVAGVAAGLVVRLPPPAHVQWLCGCAAVALLIGCWSLAFL